MPAVEIPYVRVSDSTPECDEGAQKALALYVRYAAMAKTLRVTAFVDGEERALTYQFEIEDVFQAIGEAIVLGGGFPRWERDGG